MDEIKPEPQLEPEKLTVQEKKIKHRGYLEKLPPLIRKELDDYMRLKNPSAARKYIIGKYAKEHPMLAGITKTSFYAYAKKHDIKGVGDALQTEIMSTPPELL